MRHLQGLQLQVKPNMQWGGEGLQNTGGYGVRLLGKPHVSILGVQPTFCRKGDYLGLSMGLSQTP